MNRKPAVAGQFYPQEAAALHTQVLSYMAPSTEKKEVLAVISPHAGYMYSGHVAGAVFSRVHVPNDVIILGPSHRGMGAPFALATEPWEMPNGTVKMNKDLAAMILKHSRYVKEDDLAHAYEHSLEVQVPFLQALNEGFSLAAVVVAHANWDICGEIGRSLALAIKEYGRPVLIVASSDMTHYESEKAARKKDKMAIDRILALDPQGLLETVAEHSISMCGVIPATIALAACKELGARRAELVKYATSGDISGDYLQVVGYAGLYVE